MAIPQDGPGGGDGVDRAGFAVGAAGSLRGAPASELRAEACFATYYNACVDHSCGAIFTHGRAGRSPSSLD
ncbi:hypothetical protein [Arthrobacter sp. MMS24-S77]